jgi:hypothetical protein
MRVGEWTVDEADAMAQHAALLAVAAHVREATLREAIDVAEKHRSKNANEGRRFSAGTDRAFRQTANNMRNAASARETGGALTLEQSAARLHEKYGDALAKMDDAAPGERDGG